MALYHQLGYEELQLVDYFLRNTQKNKNVILDIGTNRGLFVDLFIGSNKSCEIHCFEPIKSLYNDLLEKYNRYPNVIVNNFGISNFDGFSKFNELADLETDGCSSIVERPVFKERGWKYNTYDIKVKRVDSYCIEHSIDFIDFVKIDVEGIENLVFEGMLPLMEKQRVGLIQFEYGDTFADAGSSLVDTYKLSEKTNYTLNYFNDGFFAQVNESNLDKISKINNINLVLKKND